MADPAPQSGAGKTVCVTGASGFLGSHLVKQLLERGYTVRGTVRDAKDESKYGWLKGLEAGTPGKLELFSADLMVPGSFEEAIEGCELVCHTAAVVNFNPRDPKRDVVDPSVEGTRNVFNSILRAKCAKRVVVTSSYAAVMEFFQERGKTFTEEDWHRELTLKMAYNMAKTLAEKLAWKVYEEQKAQAKGEGGWSFELVSINPGMLLGDMFHKSHAKSAGGQLLIQLVDGTLPMAPDMHFSFAHVRDAALAHILALEKESARGRYLVCESGSHSLLDVARVIKTEYPKSRAPTMVMPSALVHGAALLSPMANYENVRRVLGSVSYFSNKKYTTEFGVTLIQPERAILETVKFLFDNGVVPKPGATPLLAFPFFPVKQPPPESLDNTPSKPAERPTIGNE